MAEKAKDKQCTNLKIDPEVHRQAKATAVLIQEGLYQFVETAIKERLQRLRSEGKVTI